MNMVQNNTQTSPMDSLSSRAVLTNMIISRWRAKGRHKDIDQKVTGYLQTKRKAGSIQIDMFDPKSLKPIQNAAYNISKWYHSMTLAWDDTTRILPSALHDPFKEGHNAKVQVFHSAVDAFIPVYPSLLREAREDLGDELFELMEFPPITQIRQKFGVSLSYLPVPVSGDFRVTLSNDELDKIRGELDERNKAMLARSMHDAWKRMYDVVVDMVDRLNKPKFRDSIVSNIRELTDVLPDLNLAGDADLDGMREEIVQKLCRYTPEQLRDNDEKREELAVEAGKILGSMRRLRVDLE